MKILLLTFKTFKMIHLKMKSTFLLIFSVLLFYSCKKDNQTITHNDNILENPLVRKDLNFPNGVLQFKSVTSFKSFYEKAAKDSSYTNMVVKGFKSFKNYADEYHASKLASSLRMSSVVSRGLIDEPLEVNQTDYLYDLNTTTLPDNDLANVLNPDMEVIVDDTMYQFTRIGLFKVSLEYLSDYFAFYNTNVSSILYDINYVNTPAETQLSENEFLVLPGIVREDNVTADMLSARKVTYLDDGGGCTSNCESIGPVYNSIPDYYVNSTVDLGFKKEIAIIFNDWAKRRLLFKTQNFGFEIAGIGFHKIDIKGKVQREKKFLGITYWGESFADEIIVGFDNMSLETGYVFPYPQEFSKIVRPSFAGLADFKLGNQIIQTLNIKVNYATLGYTLNNTQLASLIDNGINSLVGSVYNNGFKLIERSLINSIDGSYLTTYAKYTTMLHTLDDEHRLKFVLGKGEKPQGYSHENTWTFDWNFGFSFTQGGGLPNYPSPDYSYNYTMKAGSFYCRARVGSVWHGIRIVVTN